TAGNTVSIYATAKNSNGVTFGTDTDGVFTASVAAVGGAQTGISGIGASDTTYTSGTVIWSGQNNITIGSSVNGASQYVRLSVGNYITTADLSQNSSKYAGTSTGFGGTNISGSITLNTSGINISLSVAAPGGGANLTFPVSPNTLH